MKDFKKFALYVGENQIKLYGSNPRNKIDRLVNGIYSGRYVNDEDAAWDLYKSKPTNKSYLMLKSRIKEQLIGSVFNLDFKKLSFHYHLKFVLAGKYLLAGQFMMNVGLSDEGGELVKEGLSLAVAGQFTGLIVFGTRLLCSRTSFFGTREEYKKYLNLLKSNLKIYEAELEADDMNNDLKLDYRKTRAPLNRKKTGKYWKRISYLNKKYDNHFLKMMYAFIGTSYYECIGDYRGIIRISDEAEKYLLDNPKFYDKARHRILSINKMEACIWLKDYDLGLKTAEACMRIFVKSNLNSLIALERYVMLCMHSKNYEKAWKLYNETIKLEMFNSYPLERHEIWRIFEAYLCFIKPKPTSKFKLNKFLNEVPVYSKDKRGVNISIIIAQIILLIDAGDFETLLDKTDAFKAYFRRYVNKSINYRTYYFVKMLLVMFDSNFNFNKTAEESRPYFDRLGDKEGHYKGDIEALEIIPYENLWPEVLQRLKKHEYSFQEPIESYKKRRKV